MSRAREDVVSGYDIAKQKFKLKIFTENEIILCVSILIKQLFNSVSNKTTFNY